MAQDRVVVVGSGPCGAVAAWQLVQRGIPVTMLESGTLEPDGLLVRAFGRNIYRRKPRGDFGSDCGEHRASGDPKTKWYFSLSLGGLSNHWTGAVPRFAEQDFSEGARLHEKYRWPITYADLVSYYDSVERLMGVVASGTDVPNLPGGYAADMRLLPADWEAVASKIRARGQGLTTLPIADGPRHLVTRQGTAFNSYTGIVKQLLASPLFSLRQGVHALRLDWSSAVRRVNAVIYRDRSDGLEHSVDAAAFVVAGGPIQSTRLLFDSVSADFPQGLGNSHDVLGRYLHDHPREWWVLKTSRPMSRLSPSIYLTRRTYADSEPLLATSWTIGAPSTKEKLLSFTPIKATEFGVQVFGTMVPTADMRVAPVAGAFDTLGASKLDINIRFDEPSLKTLEGAQARLLELMDLAGVPSQILPVPPDQIAPGSSVHYAGTARMHASPEFGVVDAYNRVFDAPNVLVCDAACFTTGAEKNPTLTAMAIAARACDHLANHLKTGVT